MKRITLRLRPLSAFGTPPLGDTLFGQLCWLVRQTWGNTRLEELLQGYQDGAPFAVVSDFFPSGYLPRPALPAGEEILDDPNDRVRKRKALKKKKWVPISVLNAPVERWINFSEAIQVGQWVPQYRNSINRRTGTTGKGEFAPYEVTQFWYGGQSDQGKPPVVTELDCYIDVDDTRISPDTLVDLFTMMGYQGYGKDATVGAGRFEVTGHTIDDAPVPNTDTVMTLANCVPAQLSAEPEQSYYRLFVRFGRHGGEDVHTGRPFKAPILMAERGALFRLTQKLTTSFVGVGLGGHGELSNARAETVHQGYAPVIGVLRSQGSVLG